MAAILTQGMPAPEAVPDDRVITPLDEIARVAEVSLDGSELELVYVGALNKDRASFRIRASLCRVWLHGEPRPKPVRLER